MYCLQPFSYMPSIHEYQVKKDYSHLIEDAITGSEHTNHKYQLRKYKNL